MPLLRSTISWAMRVRVRPMRSASMTTGISGPPCGCRCARTGNVVSCHLFAVSRPALKSRRQYSSDRRRRASSKAATGRRRGPRYTRSMPVDVEARVLRNTRLSSDYNVIALAAPEIAAVAAPGQFVMVKPGRGLDPLLRRPFSVFEILRENGQVHGLTLLSKRIGVTTRMLFDAVEGDIVSCLGPLGRPFDLAEPPRRGLDGRRRCRPRALRHARRRTARAGHADNAVLRRTQRAANCSTRLVPRAWRAPGAVHRRRQPRRRAAG